MSPAGRGGAFKYPSKPTSSSSSRRLLKGTQLSCLLILWVFRSRVACFPTKKLPIECSQSENTRYNPVFRLLPLDMSAIRRSSRVFDQERKEMAF